MDKPSVVILLACLITVMILVIIYKYKIGKLSKNLSMVLDKLLEGEEVDFQILRDRLGDKTEYKLKRLMEIEKHKKELAEGEKKKLDSLLGDIAHQIKTPIANIKMYNNILIERQVERDKQLEFLTLNNQQIEKIEFLFQSMLKMSRLENGVLQLHPIYQPIHPLLGNVLIQIEPKIQQKNLTLTVRCEESLHAVFDLKWTEEAIFNILDNAVKYSNEQGNIDIEVEELDLYTILHIRDYGIGISENEHGQIFQRFYRSPEVSAWPGVGIGLALTREIISKEQGFITVKSEPEKGAQFSTYLLRC